MIKMTHSYPQIFSLKFSLSARLPFGISLVMAALFFGSGYANAQVPDLGGLSGLLGNKSPKTDTTSQKNNSDANSKLGILGTIADVTKEESTEEELQVGRGVAVKMFGALKPVKNPKVQNYVGKVGMLVASQGERKNLPWRFVVVDSSSINAFALPGGIVIVTKGLFDLLETEDELAAVLGHEIAHVQRKHHFNVVKQQKLVGSMSSVVSSEVAKDNALIAGYVSRATEIMARGLDKSAEYEADRDGVVLAARAGYDSSAMFTVLEKLAAGVGSGKDAALLYSTHPSPEERLSSLSQAITTEIEDASGLSAAADRLKKTVKQK